MRILFDIAHPAHVHFFKNPALILKERGHELMITSRDKDVALDLLNELEITHKPISALDKKPSLFGFASELIKRDYALWQVAKIFQPDVMAAIGGTFISHVRLFTRIPSLVFYDTENATLQNAITYPFASCVIVPSCYNSWVPKNRHVRYRGYHELSYLHPNYFSPNLQLAQENGLSKSGDTFLIRIVSWEANHDIGEKGWTIELLESLIDYLTPLGKIIISSEAPLPEKFKSLNYRGQVSDIHHVMAYCRLYIGESATMASESAVLGVPAIYAAQTGRGYTDEQELRYDLVKNINTLTWVALEQAIQNKLSQPKQFWKDVSKMLLNETIDVANYTADAIEQLPHNMQEFHSNSVNPPI